MLPETQVTQVPARQVRKKAIAVYLTREALSVAGMAVMLFWPAGRLDWGMGWALVALWAGWVAAMAWIVIWRTPDLLMERLGAKRGSKNWDAIIASSLGLLQGARCILGGFDHRFGWTSGISLPVQVAFLIIGILGGVVFIWAVASNKFFSQVVRIQTERGHTVAQEGPYRFIRHPGYAGSILMEIGAPLTLGSWWALLPSAIFILLMIVRTTLEERALKVSLPDYPEYAKRVKYRLLPGIW